MINLRKIIEQESDEKIPIIIGLIEIKCTISGLMSLTVLIIEILSLKNLIIDSDFLSTLRG